MVISFVVRILRGQLPKILLHSRTQRIFVRITYEIIFDKSLFIIYTIDTETKGEKTMLWIIFIIWVVFAVTCAILAETTENELFGFIFLLSLPMMFYVPFFFI